MQMQEIKTKMKHAGLAELDAEESWGGRAARRQAGDGASARAGMARSSAKASLGFFPFF